jgi:nitroreductase
LALCILVRLSIGQAIANLTFQATVSGLVVHQIAGFDVEKNRREFSIPQDYEPVAAAAAGYPGRRSTKPTIATPGWQLYFPVSHLKIALNVQGSDQ